MRKIIGLLILLIVCFASCEGRKTKSQALSEDIEAFKKSVTIEIDTYKPESYVERETDTLLSNGYRIKIKTFSDMDNSVLFTKIKDTVNYQIHYRNYEFDIVVEKNGKSIFKKRFNKEIINKLFRYDTVTKSNIEDYDFDKLGILKSVELVDNLQLSNTIKIDVLYTIPETDRLSLHTLFIDKEGILKVERVEMK